MKNIYLLLLLSLFLLSCNNRENLLLPPNLKPEDYQTSNTIELYSDYLIKSTNDDSYLLIPKTSILDEGINYGDRIVFERSQSFVDRDSLAFQNGLEAISNTYNFKVVRDNAEVNLQAIPELARIYTNTLSNIDEAIQISLGLDFTAMPINAVSYNDERMYFELDRVGEHALYNFANATDLLVEHRDVPNLLALARLEDTNYFFTFPAEYLNAAQSIEIQIGEDLSDNELQLMYNTYEAFAMSSVPIKIQSTNPIPQDLLAYLKISGNGKRDDVRWLRLNDNQLLAWENLGSDGSVNWTFAENETYTFLLGSGTYFFASQLISQELIRIPLDGSQSNVYLNGLWLDLMGIAVSGLLLELDLSPATEALQNSYFSGNPWQIQNNAQSFSFQMYSNDIPIDTLPDGKWLEFGFRGSSTQYNQHRLYHCEIKADSDVIVYKKYGTSYDDSHFAVQNGNIYSSITASGLYLFAKVTDVSNPYTIPKYKDSAFLQTEFADISWGTTAKKQSPKAQRNPYPKRKTPKNKKSISAITVNPHPSLPLLHPWLSGSPLSLSSPISLAEIWSVASGKRSNSLPEGFHIAFKNMTSARTVFLFDHNPQYPILMTYQKSTNYEGYVFTDNQLRIYPAIGGYIFEAALPAQDFYNLMLYSKFSFSLPDMGIYHDDESSLAQPTILNIRRAATIPDTHEILRNQYLLSQTSPAYTFTAMDPQLFENYFPLVLLKRNSRANEKLFTEVVADYYRLYPYEYGTNPDALHFTLLGDYNAFYLAHNGAFATYTDLDPHTIVNSTVLSASQTHVVSLYQAQFDLPAFFIGSTIPLGGSISLENVDSVAGVNSILTGYEILFRNAAQDMLYPDFFNVIGATLEPYIYIPVDDLSTATNCRLYYRSMSGVTTELTRVEAFTDNWATEYTVYGNSLIAMVPGAGVFYVTQR